MSNGQMKAIDRLVGTAAQAVVADEANKPLKQMQLPPQWPQTTTTASTQPIWGQLGHASTTGPSYIYGSIYSGGGGASTSSGYAQTADSPSKPTIEFTDEQRASFLAKLADLLTKGWECLRCHRIWSPQTNGCEFCNFIDRLEGKDVERDDESAKAA